MVLTEADKQVYFPFVELTGLALTGAIQRAQMTAETIAGRPMTLTQFTETIAVPPSREIGLRYAPVALDRPITVTVEGELMRDSDWSIDADDILRISSFVYRNLNTIGVSYWAGFNFADNSDEVKSIKSAVAAILNYQTLT